MANSPQLTGGLGAALNLTVLMTIEMAALLSQGRCEDEARQNVCKCVMSNREPDTCRILHDASVGQWWSFHKVVDGRSTTEPV